MSTVLEFGLFIFFAVTGLFCVGYVVYAVLDSIVSRGRGSEPLHARDHDDA